MNEATVAAGWFTEFLKHGSAVSLLLSLGFGWGLSILLSYPIHWNVKDPEKATYCARIVCVLASFGVTAGTWPNEFRWSWALFMGVASPLLGLAVLWWLRKKYPDLVDNVLAMKKQP